MKAIILPTRSPIRRPSLRRGFLLIPLLIARLGLAPMVQAVGPDTDGNIPGSNNDEGIGVLISRTGGVWNTGTGFGHLTTSLRATKIRRRVFEPCLAIAMAASTPPLAFYLSLAIPAGFSIVPLAPIRWQTTRTATTTLPTVMERSIITPKATTTRPTVLLRFITTPPASTTRPTVIKRS